MTEDQLNKIAKIETIESKILFGCNIMRLKYNVVYWLIFISFTALFIHFSGYFIINDHSGSLGLSLLLNIVCFVASSLAIGLPLLFGIEKIYGNISMKHALNFIWPYRTLLLKNSMGCDPYIKRYLHTNLKSTSNIKVKKGHTIKISSFVDSISCILKSLYLIKKQVDSNCQDKSNIKNIRDVSMWPLVPLLAFIMVATLLNDKEQGWSNEITVSQQSSIAMMLTTNKTEEFRKYVRKSMKSGINNSKYWEIVEKDREMSMQEIMKGLDDE
jgi:hypothetical protein